MTDYKMNRRPIEEYDSESMSSNNLLCPGTNGNMPSTGIRLITAMEAARVLHISRNAVYTLWRKGALIKEYALGECDLRKGVTGNDVREMQTRLKELGYDLGKYGIDGDFGSDTQTAVMKFQTDNGLEATGVYDAATHEKLTDDHVINKPEVKPVISGPTVEIVTKNGGAVNMRVGNGTEYEIIKELNTGEVLEYIATAGNGWNAVKVGTQVGWVSGEYSKKSE